MGKNFVPRICLDFDGVIHSYTSGWKGPRIISDPPVPGAFGFIYAAIGEGFEVNIFSSRSSQFGGRKAMRNWLFNNGMDVYTIELIKFPKKKPQAILYIDDRAFCFKGTFPTFDFINNFRVWNKKE